MVDCVITVLGKIAEYTVAHVLRQFGYVFCYKSNVEDLTEKITTLTATRDGVQLQVEAAERNSQVILPGVMIWLNGVNSTIQEKDTCFEQGRVEKATTCCSSKGWCPNLKVRHSLSRTATKMTPRVEELITAGQFTTISCAPPPLKIQYQELPYLDDPTEVQAEPHEGASSSSGTSNRVEPPTPMGLSERLKYRLPYTKDLLTALRNDKISLLGVVGRIREIDTVSTEEFTRRMKHINLFEEVVLDLSLKNLAERAEWLRGVLLASDFKRVLVILTDAWGTLDLEAVGISRVVIKESCKIMLISQLSDVFGEMKTQTNFKLLSQSIPKARPVEFESRISVIREVMDALTDDESNPILLHGMGGIGKTTLLMEIGAKASEVDLFGDVAIAEFSLNHEPELSKIQGKLANDLGLTLKKEDDRAAKLRERISGSTKTVLIILDNVWNDIDLWKLGIPISDDLKSCKLLVSSRNRDIFKMRTKRNVYIEGLPTHDAWNLFKKFAGGSIESDPKLRPIAKEVLKQCDGLPVAISTVGGALQGKSIEMWKNALRQLKQSCPEDVPEVISKVYESIKFSYECVPSKGAKSCFLLCCLFPESQDLPINELVMIGLGLDLFTGIGSISEARNLVIALVDILKSRSLLLDGNGKGCVRMHDVVRDVGVYMASKELAQKKNELGSRVVIEQDVGLNNGIKESTYCSSLTTNMSTTELLMLLSLHSDYWYRPELSVTILDRMEDLKVLYIRRSTLTSLPFLKNLQTLILLDCDHINFDVIGELRTLMVLTLSGFKVDHLPGSLKNLSNLRLLDVSGCCIKTVSEGVISSLSRLEEFYMWDNTEPWRCVQRPGSFYLNGGAFDPYYSEETYNEYEELCYDRRYEMNWREGLLSELLCLSCLTTLEVSLPVGIMRASEQFHKLERFNISFEKESYGGRLDIQNYLRVYDLDASSLADTVIGFLFKETKKLELKMKNLEDPFNVIDVNCCANLESLTLEDCDSLKYLVDMTMSVKQDTPRSVFPVLNDLEINGATKLEEIFHGDLPLGSLQKLERLDLRNLPACQTISPKVVFQNLTSLSVRTCGNLKYLLSPLVARSLVKLQKLVVLDCEKIEEIVAANEGEVTEHEWMLPGLIDFTLENLPNLGSFSQGKHIFDWPLLESIDISNCNKMNKFCLGSLILPREVDMRISDSGENLKQELNDSKKQS